MSDGGHKVTFDDLDDPELRLATARIAGGCFVVDGWLDGRQALGLAAPGMDRRSAPRALSREHGAFARDVAAPLRLVIPAALTFEISDRAMIGVTVPERFDAFPGGVTIVGMMECDVTVWTSSAAHPIFEFAPLLLQGVDFDFRL